VPLEQQLLSNPKLAAYQDKLTWLFVSRNFKGDESDREAERTHDRFGITCWPVLVVFDPRDDKVLAADELGRTFERCSRVLDGLLADPIPKALAAESRPASSASRPDADPQTLLADPSADVRARALEDLVLAKAKLDAGAERRLVALLSDAQEDIVVRIRAARALNAMAPARVAEHAEELLAVPNDPLRYAVLTTLAAHPSPGLARTLDKMFAGAGTTVPSVNPNVLRIHVAKCFADSGDAQTVDVLAPLARSANPRNGLSPVILRSLAALAVRIPEVRDKVIGVLLESFPAAVADGADAAEARVALGLARAAHEALGVAIGRKDLPKPPAAWTASEREAYLKLLR
jgi:hypothetical protein